MKKAHDDLKQGEVFIRLWDYPHNVNALNRLLKPYGIRIKDRGNYKKWGDTSIVSIQLVKD